MDIETIASTLKRADATLFKGSDGDLNIDLGDTKLLLQLRDGSCTLADASLGAAPTLKMSPEDFAGFFAGTRDFGVALRKRRVQFEASKGEGIDRSFGIIDAALDLVRLDGRLAASLLPFYVSLGTDVRRTAITTATVRTLYELAKELSPANTLEVGFAFGYSAIAIGTALEEHGKGEHTGIDPFQVSHFENRGIANVAAAGLQGRTSVIVEPDFLALPNLLREGKTFQLVFIDGNHMVDFTFLDFFYAERLLDVGGVIVIDDVHLDEVDQVVQFIHERRSDFEPIPSRSSERTSVFRKIGADIRTEFSECQYLARRRRF